MVVIIAPKTRKLSTKAAINHIPACAMNSKKQSGNKRKMEGCKEKMSMHCCGTVV